MSEIDDLRAEVRKLRSAVATLSDGMVSVGARLDDFARTALLLAEALHQSRGNEARAQLEIERLRALLSPEVLAANRERETPPRGRLKP